MALFLVQHGISAKQGSDIEKSLTNKGTEQTELIAQVAKGYNVDIKQIVHSGKTRAKQTAEIFHETLSLKTHLAEVHGIQPLDDVYSFSKTIVAASSTMIIGHLPFMQRLVSYLITGSTEIMVYKFQNSGIACLDCETSVDGSANWFIKWTLNPNIS